MDYIRKFWPKSFDFQRGNVKGLVWRVVIMLVLSAAISTVLGLFSFIPVLGTLLSIVSYVADLYLTAGVVFCFLHYFEVGPFKG